MQPTPGYTTTEFWATLLADIVAILALFHVGLPAHTPDYVQAVALLASAIATGIYTHSRQQLKVAALQSNTASGAIPIVTTSPVVAPPPSNASAVVPTSAQSTASTSTPA
jgi:predicted Kef-type K+ transport protein